MAEELPGLMGAAGLTGRPLIVRDVELEIDEDGYEIPIRAKSMPPACRRVMHRPWPERDDGLGGCNPDCPGRQRDGSCLVEIVKAADAHGIDWLFEVGHEGERLWWDYVGPPIPKED